MKKLIKTMAVLAAIAMMFGTVACSNGSDDDDDYVSSTESTTTSSTASSSTETTESTSTESTSDETEFVLDSSTETEEEEYSLELEDGKIQLTIYYYREAGYDDCDVWVWSVNGSSLGGQPFHKCSNGWAKMVVNVDQATNGTNVTVGFIIRTNCSNPGQADPNESWEDKIVKDATDSNRFVTLQNTNESTTIYTIAGDANSYDTQDAAWTAYQTAKSSETTTE